MFNFLKEKVADKIMLHLQARIEIRYRSILVYGPNKVEFLNEDRKFLFNYCLCSLSLFKKKES